MSALTCQVGQAEPCGQPATHAIAVVAVQDTAWAEEARPGGVVFMCDEHAKTPVSEWENR